MGKFESGLGQCDLSLSNDEGEHLFITQVPVWLRAKFKQLPYHHPQRPGSKEDADCERLTDKTKKHKKKKTRQAILLVLLLEVCCYIITVKL